MKTRTLFICCGLALAAMLSSVAFAQGPLLPLAGSTVAPPALPTASEKALRAEIAYWRKVAGATALRGPGLVVEMRDRATEGPRSVAAPGLVHDYDLLEVVNGLRAAGAEAIAINGVRVGAGSAIRAVGPRITVAGQTLAHPYRIEAIGDAARMNAALTAPKGWLSNYQNGGPRVTTARAAQLRLPPVKTPTAFRFGKPE